jgi:hypothetical protein
MSSVTEYMTVWVHWNQYYDDDIDNAKNFRKNMYVFDEHMKGFIEEGWRPHGPPQFSAGWFTGCTKSGSVVQAIIRETEPIETVGDED